MTMQATRKYHWMDQFTGPFTKFHRSKPAVQTKRTRSIYEVFSNLGLLTLGCTIYLIGLKGIIVPQGFLNGGLVGITLILQHFTPSVELGLLYLALNVPLFILGWFQVGRRFVFYTIYGVVSFSILTDYVPMPQFPVVEPLLAAAFGGIICGIGAGITLRSSGSAGGLDILAIYLKKKLSIPLGATGFSINVLILGGSAFLFGLDIALYTAIFVFVQGKVIDKVVSGFNKRKSLMIISERSEDVAKAIMDQLHRGVTYLDGVGAYTGQSKKVIFSVATMTEMSRMQDLVFTIDPTAFMVINDTSDVFGCGLGQRKVY